jgi:hypothetical protein
VLRGLVSVALLIYFFEFSNESTGGTKQSESAALDKPLKPTSDVLPIGSTWTGAWIQKTPVPGTGDMAIKITEREGKTFKGEQHSDNDAGFVYFEGTINGTQIGWQIVKIIRGAPDREKSTKGTIVGDRIDTNWQIEGTGETGAYMLKRDEATLVAESFGANPIKSSEPPEAEQDQQSSGDDSFIPADVIKVTASSEYVPEQAAIHLLDGSGMDGLAHDNHGSAFTMWHTTDTHVPSSPAPGLERSPAWVRFDFAKPQKFTAMMIWNHNQCDLTDRGFRKTRLYGTSDGAKWFPLTAPNDVIELPRAGGTGPEYAIRVPNAAVHTPIKSVIIAATMKDGNYGGVCYGLSAVRFVAEHP